MWMRCPDPADHAVRPDCGPGCCCRSRWTTPPPHSCRPRPLHPTDRLRGPRRGGGTGCRAAELQADPTSGGERRWAQGSSLRAAAAGCSALRSGSPRHGHGKRSRPARRRVDSPRAACGALNHRHVRRRQPAPRPGTSPRARRRGPRGWPSCGIRFGPVAGIALARCRLDIHETVVPATPPPPPPPFSDRGPSRGSRAASRCQAGARSTSARAAMLCSPRLVNQELHIARGGDGA
jgi:hypothetical protein